MLCLMLDMSDFPAIFATNDRWLTTKLYDNERVVLWMTSLVFRSKTGHLRMTFDFEKHHITQQLLMMQSASRARVRHIQTQSYMQVGHYCGRLFCCVVGTDIDKLVGYDLEVKKKSLPLCQQ